MSIQLPELTNEELSKINLTKEALEHYSQPDEIKRLLVEREMYKRTYEEQQKRITTFVTEFDKIMEKPIRNEFGRTQSLRSWVREKYWQVQYEQLKPRFTKIAVDYEIDPDFIKRFKYNIKY